jgi:hypothetical protein
MITINLLPEEYRRSRRTPLRMLAVIAAAVAINGSLIAWWSWTAFGVKAELDSRLSVLKSDMDALRPQVEYHRALERENKEFQSRESTLGQITMGRTLWTEKLDQLIDVINRGGDGEKYLIWMDDLNFIPRVDQRRGTVGTLRAEGHSGSGNFAHVANFLEDLERSDFAKGFLIARSPQGSLSNRNPELIPSETWSFPIELHMRAPEQRPASRNASRNNTRGR